MPALRAFVATLLLLVMGGCAAHTTNVAAAPTVVAQEQLRRGVNVLGYDPIWKDPARARFQKKHFATIRAGGFDFIRLNLQAFSHMDTQNRLDAKWLERLDWVVREATDAGLAVIIDEHDFNACAEDVAACRVRLTSFWQQVAPRYRDAPRSVLFEPLNEPHGPLDAPTWNGLFAQILAVIRESNPTRTVVVGPTSWNSFKELESLQLPESDRNLLVTFHYYDPFRFTHQGASWTDLKELRGVTWGTPEDHAQLRADFERVAAWAREHRRPILLGEFGAFDRSGTPVELRAAYTAAVAREAERQGFSWAYWQFDSDFVVWDMTKDEWVAPLHDALIPPGQ